MINIGLPRIERARPTIEANAQVGRGRSGNRCGSPGWGGSVRYSANLLRPCCAASCVDPIGRNASGAQAWGAAEPTMLKIEHATAPARLAASAGLLVAKVTCDLARANALSECRHLRGHLISKRSRPTDGNRPHAYAVNRAGAPDNSSHRIPSPLSKHFNGGVMAWPQHRAASDLEDVR